jgi:ActR/RegA family two-component response regulator
MTGRGGPKVLTSAEKNARRTRPAKHRTRALVVDWDAGSRATLALLLARNGFVVKLANTVAGATEVLDTFDPEAVFITTAFYAASDLSLIRQLRERRAGGLRLYGLVSPRSPAATMVPHRDFTALLATPVRAEHLMSELHEQQQITPRARLALHADRTR